MPLPSPHRKHKSPSYSPSQSTKHQRAFTLLEILVVLATVAVVGSVAIAITSTTVERSNDQKLRSDVQSLNQAVQVYLANGGDLTAATDADEVLSQLKTRLSAEDAQRFAGLTSSMVDARLTPIYQSQEEADSDHEDEDADAQ